MSKRDSWIRRWFSRQNDFALWCCFIAWVACGVSGAIWVVGLLAAVVR